MKEERDGTGRTVLARAVMSGDNDQTHQLLSAGHSSNARDRKGWTPVLHAASHRNAAILKTLIQHGGDVNHQNKRKMTPLMLACQYGGDVREKREVVKVLLEICEINTSRDRKQRTHLHWAVKSRDYEIFKLVFDKWDKTNLLVVDAFDKTVLFDAVMLGNMDITRGLLAESPTVVQGLLIMENKHHKLPLHIAAETNNLDAVKCFLAQGGQDVNTLTGMEFTPLVCASRACALEVMDYLLSLWNCDVNRLVSYRRTALFQTIVTYFNHSRVNARRRNPNPSKPFATAIFKLLAANADPNVKSIYGIFSTKKHNPPQNALTIAVKGGLQDVVEMLAYSGCGIGGQLSAIFDTPDDMLSKYLKLNLDLVYWVREYFSTPPTLKRACRRQIRDAMGEQFRFKVVDLPLPTTLKEYLCLNELRGYCENEGDYVTPGERKEVSSDVEYENSIYDSNEHLDTLESLED